MTHQPLTLNALEDAVAGAAAAIRSITRLEPAGGPGDKVFPPTYMKEGKSETKYAMEERIIDGRHVMTVLLDSVASQANRMEEALLEGWRRGDLAFPVVQVDFTGEEGLGDLDCITSLQAPHRIADALLRDSLLDGVPFRSTTIGREFQDSRPSHATGMFQHCPTALVLGCWDSTGPRGGMGSKFQRCLVSEIVGFDVVTGVKTASRIDPAGIEKKSGLIYESKADPSDWTVLLEEAATEKGKPKLFGGKGAEGKGTPATVNHGNIPPSINADSGGVTMAHAVQTTVLSLAGLRRLRFQTTTGGERIPPAERDGAERAARVALAALALAAVVFQRENDFDLRSRSLLVACGPLVLAMVGRDGGEPRTFSLNRAEATQLLAEASKKAAAVGLRWEAKPVNLKPAPKLAHLIRESRKLAAAGESEETT